MKTVSAENLLFKKSLSMIEQMSLKDFLFKWLGIQEEGLGLQYTEDGFAKLEIISGTEFTIHGNESFRYITLTEDNQIIIGFLDEHNCLQHKVVSMDERLMPL